MRIRILGGGWYGSHLACALLADGHDAHVFDVASRLFSGASGGNPARCHLGFHYPRSAETRIACIGHQFDFMRTYGHLTRGVPINIYAVAAEDSLVDFGTYCKVMQGHAEFIRIEKPAEFGLQNVEGAVLTGERHVIIDKVRSHFERTLVDRIHLNAGDDDVAQAFDLTIDCTFSAMDAERVDRYEPCITGLLTGPVDKAVTIMDGAFPSIYPWNEELALSSITSAKLTPLSKDCKSYAEARDMLMSFTEEQARERCEAMLDQMAYFWPEARKLYRIASCRKSIRAMPKSKADTRLADVARVSDNLMRVRAGKIDAVFHAEALVKAHIDGLEPNHAREIRFSAKSLV